MKISVTSELQNHKYLRILIVLLSVLYFAASITYASWRQLWYDEVLSSYIVSTGSFSKIWDTLLLGFEGSPPFFFFIELISINIFGHNELGLRIPSILGFFFGLVAIYSFVKFRTECAFSALVAALIPVVTFCYEFAVFEARPYALLFGFSAVAMFCWQQVIVKEKNILWLCAMFIALACVVSVHYYGLLLLIPLGIAEVVRAIQRRRIDFLNFALFIFALFPLFLTLKQVQSFSLSPKKVWSRATFSIVEDCYYYFFQDTYLFFIFVVILIALVAYKRRNESGTSASSSCTNNNFKSINYTAPELSVIIATVLIPFFCYLLTLSQNAIFIPRYSIVMVVGVSLLFPLILSISRDCLVLKITSIGLVFLCFLTAVQKLSYYGAVPEGELLAKEASKILGNSNLPLVDSSGLSFLPRMRYLPNEFRKRIFYISDPELALNYLPEASFEYAITGLAKLVPLNMSTYQDFTARYSHFIVEGNSRWIIPHLLRSGAEVRLLRILFGKQFFEVKLKPRLAENLPR